MARSCLCLTARTISRNLEILNKYRKFTDIAELRVDCLDTDERLSIRRFPELARMPVILTIRRDIDGGHFTGGEGSRVKLFAQGLAYANTDSRFNFAYVDIEDDLDVPSLEEAARTYGTRIIRSYHNFNFSTIDNFTAKIKSIRRSSDEIVKAAVSVNSTRDMIKIYNASKACEGQDKIIIGIGNYGIYSRILAEKFGSFLTYSCALYENEIPGAAGQLDIQELEEMYHFKKINKNTKIFGIAGNPLKASISPWFFNNIFMLENLDAAFVPFPCDSIKDLLELAVDMDVQGISITVPFKETVLFAISKCSDIVRITGACNTIYRLADASNSGEVTWFGDNTDCAAFSKSLLGFLGWKNLKRKKITIIGAGGVAHAVASEVYRLGGKALILNRSVHKAKNLALKYNFQWGGLDKQGVELMSKNSNIIIQATSVGMEGYENADILEVYSFTGKEIVMELIYTPVKTPFLKRAAAAGCKTINGYDMVIRQACMQYAGFTGKEFPKQLLTRLSNTGDSKWNRIKSG